MNSNWKLLPAAVLVAMLALAGCGGGSDDTPTEPPTPTEPTEPPGPTALETAVDEQGKAAAASAAAAGLLEAAVEASAVQAHDVDGSSQMAYDNAMTVLGTGALIEAERAKAAAAVMAIEGIDTSDMSAAEMARIAGILETAKASLAEIVAIQEAGADDEGSLAEAVMAIKTGTKVGADDSEVAKARAKVVSDAIMAAILTGTVDGSAVTTATVTASAASSGAPEGAVMRAGMAGMTFADIAGSASMKATKLGDFTDTADPPVALAAIGTANSQGGALPAMYKGIPGDLVCLSAGGCAADADDDLKITGDLQFVPDSPTTLYFQASVGDDYTRLTNAASYGYWLDDNMIQLHHASSSENADGSASTLMWGVASGEDDVETSYSGDAMGYSHRTVGEGDDATTSSGEFTANVMLDAVFSDAPADSNLSGSISGFAGGAHVNPAWYVTLGEVSFDSGLAINTVTGTVTSGEAHGEHFAVDGDWRAHGYGADGKNPTGFVGAFDAQFGDGEAAGVYHAD